MKKVINLIGVLLLMMVVVSCQSESKVSESKSDVTPEVAEAASVPSNDTVSGGVPVDEKTRDQAKAVVPKILIYSFHVTNRCASCIAIEESVKKTLEVYFKNEVKSGQIKLNVLNVDDEANEKIAEKYQAFGSGLFVTRVYQGKEVTSDFTGEGFKYARNKQEKFIELLKTRIQEYLK